MSKFKEGDQLTIQAGDPYHFFPVGTEVTVARVTDEVSSSGLGRIYLVSGSYDGTQIQQSVAEIALTERQPAEV